MELLTLVGPERIYLDANVFIYALEGFPAYAPALRSLFEAIDRGEILAATSELTLAEVLVKPIRARNEELQRAYLEAIRERVGLRVAPVSRGVLVDAAALRARDLLRLPDGIHVATASAERCGALLTNDDRIRSSSELRIIMLPELSVGLG